MCWGCFKCSPFTSILVSSYCYLLAILASCHWLISSVFQRFSILIVIFGFIFIFPNHHIASCSIEIFFGSSNYNFLGHSLIVSSSAVLFQYCRTVDRLLLSYLCFNVLPWQNNSCCCCLFVIGYWKFLLWFGFCFIRDWFQVLRLLVIQSSVACPPTVWIFLI